MKLFRRKVKTVPTEPQTRKARLWAHFKSLASTVTFVWLFTSGVAQATMVPTPSMVPTILVGDHFFLDKVAFPGNYPTAIQPYLPERTIRRGDIVAFFSPEDPELRLVKRVIALPGDEFEIRAGEVYIDGKKLDDEHAMHRLPSDLWRSQNVAARTIPPDSFFMMGDNRDGSYDGRYWGFLPRDNVRGRPLLVYYSFDGTTYKPLPFFTSIRWGRIFTMPQ